jgi:hypothetical protein
LCVKGHISAQDWLAIINLEVSVLRSYLLPHLVFLIMPKYFTGQLEYRSARFLGVQNSLPSAPFWGWMWYDLKRVFVLYLLAAVVRQHGTTGAPDVGGPNDGRAYLCVVSPVQLSYDSIYRGPILGAVICTAQASPGGLRPQH